MYISTDMPTTFPTLNCQVSIPDSCLLGFLSLAHGRDYYSIMAAFLTEP